MINSQIYNNLMFINNTLHGGFDQSDVKSLAQLPQQ